MQDVSYKKNLALLKNYIMKKHMSFTVRLNDLKNETREEEFKRLASLYHIVPSEVVRSLVDAWMQYEADHGAPPKFPVKLEQIPARGSEKKRG